jgi:hypothetical protein
MKRSRRFDAMFIVVCMLMSAFVALSLSVTAHYDAGGDLWLIHDDATQEPTAAPASDVELIYNWDPTNNKPYWLGDNDAYLTVVIGNSDTTNSADNVEVTMSSTDSILTDVEAQDGNLGTTYTIGTIAVDPAQGPPYPSEAATFKFNIANSGSIGTHELQFTISYERGGSPEPTRNPNAHIYISSVFDDSSTPDEHPGIPRLNEVQGDTPFEAGEIMQEGSITLTDYTGDTISDISASIPSGLPGGITFSDNQDTAVIPTIASPQVIRWWINVAAGTAPDIYTGNIQFVYTRNGETITETGQTIDISIDYTPVVVASATVPDVAQNEKNVTISVTFQNIGNVNLIQMWIRMSEISIADGNDEFLFTPLAHYEGTTKKVSEWYELNIGTDDRFSYTGQETSAAVTIVKEVDYMIPPGDHKVLFEWMGWYYNDGSIGDPSEFQHVVQTWGSEMDNNAVMHNPVMWKDEAANGLYPDAALDEGTGDVIDGDPWQDGTYIWFESTDTDIDLYGWLSDDNGDPIDLFAGYAPTGEDADVSFKEIYVTFDNQEKIDFKEMWLTMATGSSRPFLNPVNHALTSVDMYVPDSADSIDADSEATFAFFVDINVAWWQTNSLEPGVYEVPVTIEATNSDTGDRITPTTIDIMMNVNGFGPELFAEMVNFFDVEDHLDPGETFTLEISIMNYGDDTAREVDVYLRADFVAGWSIVDQFVTAISPYEGQDTSGGGTEVGDASWGWADDWEHYDYFNRTEPRI